MFKSKIEEDLKAIELALSEDTGLCYEIVKESTEEKPLTLEEARKLVAERYFLNKQELRDNFDDIFGNRSDPLLTQYINPEDDDFGAQGDSSINNPGRDTLLQSSDEEPEPQIYVGRGYEAVDRIYSDVEDEVFLEETDNIVGTIHSTNRKKGGTGGAMPMTNYGKGPLPFWSNVFDDYSSDES